MCAPPSAGFHGLSPEARPAEQIGTAPATLLHSNPWRQQAFRRETLQGSFMPARIHRGAFLFSTTEAGDAERVGRAACLLPPFEDVAPDLGDQRPNVRRGRSYFSRMILPRRGGSKRMSGKERDDEEDESEAAQQTAHACDPFRAAESRPPSWPVGIRPLPYMMHQIVCSSVVLMWWGWIGPRRSSSARGLAMPWKGGARALCLEWPQRNTYPRSRRRV
jgi:hypothetical protein